MKVRVIQDIAIAVAEREFAHFPGQVLGEDHPLHPFKDLLNAGHVEPIGDVVEAATLPKGKKQAKEE